MNDKVLYNSNGQFDSFDRLTTFDLSGVPKTGLSGGEARGETIAQEDKKFQMPYNQSYTFGVFGGLTQRLNETCGVNSWYGQNFDLNYTYQNNRITNSGWEHDEDGRVTKTVETGEILETEYDAKGQITSLLRT